MLQVEAPSVERLLPSRNASKACTLSMQNRAWLFEHSIWPAAGSGQGRTLGHVYQAVHSCYCITLGVCHLYLAI